MMVREGDRIAIKGFRGGVEYKVDPKAKDLRVEAREQEVNPPVHFKDEWQFSFKREGSVIQVFVDSPTSKQIWSEVLATSMQPEFYLKLIGPPLPLNINWNTGRIVVSNLASDLHITSIHADIIVSKCTGELSIANQEGYIQIREHTGQVKVDSYLAKVRIENTSGDVNLYSFKGVSVLSDIKGRLEFKNGNSPLRIEKFEGELRGESRQGSVFADIRGTADVRVESAEGAVNLKLPSSGAWVNLGTADGSLSVPNFLKLTRLQSQKIRSGRLKGSAGGSVFVRTGAGDIQLR